MNRSSRIALAIGLTAAVLAACDRPDDLPDMKLSVTALAFEAGKSLDPAPEVFAVANAGRGSLVTPVVSVALREGTGWLTTEVAGTAAPYTVSVQPRTAGLSPGTYRAELTVTCRNSATPTARVPVTLVVPGPSYAISAASLAFTAPESGDPAPQTLQVGNGGRGVIPVPEVDVAYAGTGTTGWLSATVDGAAEPYAVTVTAREVAGMASGIHTATVVIGSAVLGGRRQPVDVTFTLPPRLVVSGSLAPFVPAASDTRPLSQTFTVSNAGRGVLPPPVVSTTEGWLSAKVVGSADPYTVVVSVDRWRELLAGEYTGRVLVGSPGAATPPELQVSLRVGEPVMTVSGGVSWSSYGSCPLPAPQVVTVTNTGVGVLPRPVVTLPSGAGWLDAEVIGSRAPYRVAVRIAVPPPVAPGSSLAVDAVLQAGTARATIPVSYAALVPSITGTHATPSAIVIHAQAGTGDPAPAALSVVTDGGCIPSPAVSYAYAPGDPAWLSWSARALPQRHDITLQASTAGMAPGAVRNLSLYVSSIEGGSNTPTFSTTVPLTLENATIEPTGAMSVARAGHTIVALPDGRALVTGGWSGVSRWGDHWTVASSEIYDSARGRFEPYPSMIQARTGHGAVALDDGRIVVCGGASTASSSADVLTCELTAGGPWTTIATLQRPHPTPALVELPGGKLLVVSRAPDGAGPGLAERVDLATGESVLVTGRGGSERVEGSAAVRLADGSVLVAGGPGRQAWVYDPEADLWTRTGDTDAALNGASLVPLPDGRVLAVTGPSLGGAAVYRDAGEIWDPRTGAWTPTGPIGDGYPTGGYFPAVVALANGKVVALDREVRLDFAAADVAFFDPDLGTWSAVPGTSLPAPRLEARAVRLAGGKLLIAGGLTPTLMPAAEALTW